MITTKRVEVCGHFVIVETHNRKVYVPPFEEGDRVLHLTTGLRGTANSFPGHGSGLVMVVFDGDDSNPKPIHNSKLLKVNNVNP